MALFTKSCSLYIFPPANAAKNTDALFSANTNATDADAFIALR